MSASSGNENRLPPNVRGGAGSVPTAANKASGFASFASKGSNGGLQANETAREGNMHVGGWTNTIKETISKGLGTSGPAEPQGKE